MESCPTDLPKTFPKSGRPRRSTWAAITFSRSNAASGAISYQVVKVNPDLSLQAYDAEPRAGTSYKLCCNVSADFATPSPPISASTYPSDTDPRRIRISHKWPLS